MKHLVHLFVAQFLFYLLIVANIRYVAEGGYVGTVVSDGAIVWVNYIIIQKVAASTNWRDRIALALGGMCGSAVGLLVTGA